MGYYSNFDLTVIAGEDILDTPEFIDFFEKVTLYHIDDLYDVKWYDHVKDMCTISKNFPRTVFNLWYDGEDSEDKGCYYFHNGNYTGGQAEVIYPKFSHSDFTFSNDYPELMV